MMMALGLFTFGMDTLAYQSLQQQAHWRHASKSRVGARPATQFVGVGQEQITLQGVLLPEVAGDISSLDTLRDMADTGRASALVDGTGRVYGAFVIQSIQQTHSLPFADGSPRRIAFSLQLLRVDDGKVAGGHGSR